MLALVVTCAGCGIGPNHTLSIKSLDSQISGQLRSRYPVSQVRVSCPGGVKERVGGKFSCTATLDGQKVTLTTPAGKKVECKVVRVEAVSAAPPLSQQ